MTIENRRQHSNVVPDFKTALLCTSLLHLFWDANYRRFHRSLGARKSSRCARQNDSDEQSDVWMIRTRSYLAPAQTTIRARNTHVPCRQLSVSVLTVGRAHRKMFTRTMFRINAGGGWQRKCRRRRERRHTLNG